MRQRMSLKCICRRSVRGTCLKHTVCLPTIATTSPMKLLNFWLVQPFLSISYSSLMKL
uniref:Uncharacterized protein n=1 Tax=Lotus japonicus TaxID=34305 RepID=I3SK80_LOTJA|nr:unknown [Lotus japonicus]